MIVTHERGSMKVVQEQGVEVVGSLHVTLAGFLSLMISSKPRNVRSFGDIFCNSIILVVRLFLGLMIRL